jgi:FeS assembly protein IscX
MFNRSLADIPSTNSESQIFTWDDSYAIARALQEAHPSQQLHDVSLGMIYRWTLELPGFSDDPQLANEAILTSIYLEWLEEVITQ